MGRALIFALPAVLALLASSPAPAQAPIPADFKVFYERMPPGNCANCPSYTIELAADGALTLEAGVRSMARGTHVSRLDAAQMARLIALIEAEKFDTLDYAYDDAISHTADNAVVAVTRNGATKIVSHRGGSRMPQGVRRIEGMLDDLAKARSLTWGDEQTVALLRAAGWDFASPQTGAMLVKAVQFWNAPVVEALLAAGAPLDVRPPKDEHNAKTLFAAAAFNGDMTLYRRLWQAGMRPPQDSDEFAEALLYAVQRAQAPMVAELLRLRPGAGQGTAHGQRILNAALSLSANDPARADAKARIVDLILRDGADVDMLDNSGRAPLHLASADMARVLLEAGADPNVRDAMGQPPLVTTWNEEVAVVLIEAGADLTVKGRQGTIVEIATAKRWTRALAALKARGVDPPVQNN